MTNKTLKVFISTLTLTFILTGCAKYQEPPIEPIETPLEEKKEDDIVQAPAENPETPVEVEKPIEEMSEETPVETENPVGTKNPNEDATKPSTGKPAVIAPVTQKPVVETPTDTKTPIVVELETYKTETKTETVKFQVNKMNDNNLEKGKEIVSQKGVSGSKTIEYRVTYLKGKEVKREIIKEIIVKAPVNEIVNVGTKIVTSNPGTPAAVITYKNVTSTESIAFGTIKLNDNNIDRGKEVVSQNGINGTKTITTQITYSDGKEISRKEVSNVTTKSPINKVILVGTKAIITTKNITSTESIAFNTNRVNDSSLEKGKEVVSQNGVNGTKTITTQITYSDGKEYSRKVVKTEVTKEPIDKIIKVGTKVAVVAPPVVTPPVGPVVTYKYMTTKNVIYFEVINKDDNTIFKGERKVVQEGSNGELETLTTQTFHDGKLVDTTHVNTTTKNPVDEIVHIGTKPVPLPDATLSSAEISSLIERTNLSRASWGVPQLTVSASLTKSAGIRAVEISFPNHFSHTRPDGSAFYTAGSGIYGENIAYGPGGAEQTHARFMGSPAHKENIVDPSYKTIGIATYYKSSNGATYWAVLFGK